MAKKTKATEANLDFNVDTDEAVLVPETNGKSEDFVPAERWLNLYIPLKKNGKSRKVKLGRGWILDSLRSQLAKDIEDGKLSPAQIKEQEGVVNLMDKLFDEMEAGDSKEIPLIGYFSKASTAESKDDGSDDEFEFDI